MDTNLMYVIIVIICAVLVIGTFVRFRQRARVEVRGPFGTGVGIDASNEAVQPTAGVKGENITSHQGGLTAHDETGRGVDVKGVTVAKDVELRNTSGPKV